MRWPAHYSIVLLLCAAVFISYIDRTNISVAAIAMQAQLGWNETQKGVVLSSFFIGYLLMMLAGGALANRYGGKIVLGGAVIWWSCCTILTPPAALMSMSMLVVARVALGLGEAAVFPASFNMIAQWVPPTQRSRAAALLGSSVSIASVFALPASGLLVRTCGWPMPFYAFGVLGLVWAVLWFVRLRTGASFVQRHAPPPPIPWGRLLRLPAVWAIVVAHFSFNWSLYVMLAWLPSYFKSTFGVTIANAGALSAAPWLLAFCLANVAGYVADRWLRAGRSATYVRKCMTAAGLIGGAVFLLLLPGATSVGAGLVLMCGATGAAGIAIAGFPPNCFDVSPRYADVIYSLSNTFATLPGIFGVYVTGWLVDRTGKFAAPFGLTAGVMLIGALVFLVFASGKTQLEWE
jgi:ACS family sodium-dependent inorganic phosphate cotransporter